jgi:aryl-alcohol dehydrogenase-like predicted oxidoreductase
MSQHLDHVPRSTLSTGTLRLCVGDHPTTAIPIRQLGRTRRVASALGLGLAGLGRPMYMALGRDECLGPDRSVAAMRQRCSALLDAAYAAGIRYFDTARSYGLAEAFLRSWCDDRALPPGGVTVGSKWGYVYTGAWQTDAPQHEIKRLTLDTLQWQAAESRVILGSWLSLYQVHSATLGSGVLENLDVMRELFRLRASGLTIGLTVTGPNQADAIRRSLEVTVDGVPLFETVQATWNLLEPSAGPALAEASSGGCAVIVKEVLANGRLTGRYGGPEVRGLAAYARTHGVPMEALAVSAALRQPWASVVLSGAVSCAQLRDQLAAFDISEQMRPRVRAQPPEQYWRVRSAIAWQ